MVNSPPKPCAKTGCASLVFSGEKFCEKHSDNESVNYRLTASQRGYGYRWQKASRNYLKSHPLCIDCQSKGLVVVAREVDHIIPHRLGEAKLSGNKRLIADAYKLFWSEDNWQPLCKSCHSRKTAGGQ